MAWSIVKDAPVRFRRPPSMNPLAKPVEKGSIDELRQFVNVRDEDWPALVGGLVAMLHPTGPYPILALVGRGGSAKTSMAWFIQEPGRCDGHRRDVRH